jgi:hypothetical protein
LRPGRCISPRRAKWGGRTPRDALGRHPHNAANQYLALIAPAGPGARRACANRAAPSGWQRAPRRPLKKRVLAVGAPHCKTLECLRDLPGTGFSMIWCLLRTVGVVLLYLSVARKAWRCGSAILTELLSFKASECCTFSCSSKWCNRCKARFLQVP